MFDFISCPHRWAAIMPSLAKTINLSSKTSVSETSFRRQTIFLIIVKASDCVARSAGRPMAMEQNSEKASRLLREVTPFISPRWPPRGGSNKPAQSLSERNSRPLHVKGSSPCLLFLSTLNTFIISPVHCMSYIDNYTCMIFPSYAQNF